MDQALLSSKIVVIEEPPNIQVVNPAPTSITGVVGVCERGPVGVATLVTSFEQYLQVFGGYTANADVAIAADGFFAGGGQFLWVVRTVHYTDVTNPNSKTSASASGTLYTAALAQTSGTVRAANAGPYALVAGQTLVITVDSHSPVTATFSATAGYQQSTTGPFALSNGQTLLVAINGGSVQTIHFATANFANIGAATALEVAAAINGQIIGASATVVSNKVQITSDSEGLGSSVNVTGGTSNSALTFPTGAGGTGTGTGDVQNIAAVTVAEVIAAINAAITTTGTASNDTGAPRITSATAGSASSVTVGSGSTATAIGFDNASHTGNNAGTLATMTVGGLTDGAYGNDVNVVIQASSSGDPTFFNLIVQEDGAIEEVWPNLTMNPTDPRYAPSIVNAANTGSDYIALTDLFALTSAPNNRPANQTIALTGGNDGLTSLNDADFVGSQVANHAAGTGIRALDVVSNLGLLLVPAQATPVVHNAMLSYCEQTRFGSVFAILDPPANQSAEEMVTYVQSTALLYELSEFGAIYWPQVSVANPSATVFGNANTIMVAPSGMIAGMYARTDSSKPGGVYEAPAGVNYGLLTGALGLETQEAADETKRDLVYPALINPIVGLPNLPIHVDGCRTLKDTSNFPTVGERRGVIFIEQSLKSALIFAKHRKIKSSLLSQLTRVVTTFLNTQTKNGAFASDNPKSAFTVDFGSGLNPPSEAFAQRVNGRIGLATAKPAEFIILRVGQDTRALEAQLALAAQPSTAAA